MTSVRPSSPPDHARDANGPGGPRGARIARSAWLLGALALGFYLAYIGWFLWLRGGVL